MVNETLISTCKSYSPRSRGFYQSPDGLIGVQANGVIVWLSRDRFGYRETGSTETPQGAEYVRFQDMEQEITQ